MMHRRKSATDVDVTWLIRNSSHRKSAQGADSEHDRRESGEHDVEELDPKKELCRRASVSADTGENTGADTDSADNDNADVDVNVPLRRTKSAGTYAERRHGPGTDTYMGSDDVLARTTSMSGPSASSSASASNSGSRRGSASSGKGKMGFIKSLFFHHKHEHESDPRQNLNQNSSHYSASASNGHSHSHSHGRSHSRDNLDEPVSAGTLATGVATGVAGSLANNVAAGVGSGVSSAAASLPNLMDPTKRQEFHYNTAAHSSASVVSPSKTNYKKAESPTRRGSTDSSPYISPENSRRLDDFIAHYKEKEKRALSNNSYPYSSDITMKKMHSGPNRGSIAGGFGAGNGSAFIRNGQENKPMPTRPEKLDAKGRPVPPHPNVSKFPPILKKTQPPYISNTPTRKITESNISLASGEETPHSTSHKFGAFLKKVTSYGSQQNVNSNNNNNSTLDSIDRTISNFSNETCSSSDQEECGKYSVVPGLEDLKQLKHVAFATPTYFNDPPQQICSKNPRKGEVEVKPNGSVIIHRLSADERKKIMESTSAGIVVGGSGQLRFLNPQPSTTEMEDSQKRSVTIAAEEAAAEARGSNKKEEDIEVSKIASHLTIDKPMVSRRPRDGVTRTGSSNSLLSILTNENKQNGNNSDGDVDSDPEVFPPPNLKIPYDLVYTRCCHLREILPIPATLKQLKKGSTDPIPLLQLRNPRPSLLEVWSFSDFLSIAPVLCVSLDGVSLTQDMLRIILSSLVYNPHIEKLTLRNTPLDNEGWKILAAFITKKDKNFVAIDLTMVPSIKTNVQKPSKSSLAKNAANSNTLKRMECNLENRSDMNWDLLTAAVATKSGGIEEFVLAGARMNHSQFKNFIELACKYTDRLGLAYNLLTYEQCKILAEWIVTSKIRGLDLGYNDLSGKVDLFTDAVANKVQNKGEKNEMKYISLNSTNLSVDADCTPENNEVLHLLSVLCYSENLKFLDLSNNPKIFPHCIKTLTTSLPVYVNLIRLHLDYNYLDCTSIVVLAECLPLCSKFHHLSLLGSDLNLASAKALAEAVNKSSTLMTLDLEYNDIPENIKEKISLYTMRNIQNELDQVQKRKKNVDVSLPSVPKEDIVESEKQISTLQEQLSSLLTDKFEDTDEYDRLVVKFIGKITNMRNKIEKVVRDLFDLRVKNELSCEGKETLINLCLIDSSFEQGIHLLKQRHDKIQKHDSRRRNMYKSNKSTVSTLVNSPIFSDPFENSSTTSNLAENGEQLLDGPARHRTILSSSAFGATGHSALLPFGTAAVEKSSRTADDTVEFRESENSYKRIVRGPSTEPIGAKYDILNDELKHFDADQDNDNATQTSLDIRKTRSIDSEELTRAAESLEGDKIKDFLLKNDVATIVNVIDELHEKGYHLHDIFRKQDGSEKNKEELINSLVESGDKKTAGENNYSTDPSYQLETNSNDAVPPRIMEEKAIDAAYDVVLDNIARLRSKSHT
ncbi:MAP-homologous protein 1 [Nakaseomyces bracarensis]|uniref:MAP-homologous protein 1 n=1 Tax=Nakaseomyces bracarensis TaxID=273131 RepID=A0ABR4P1B7_9SACH